MSNDNEKDLNKTEGTTNEKLNEEMKNLAEVFQQELDKTAQEAAADEAPVIQPLDFGKESDIEDTDIATNAEKPGEPAIAAPKKAKSIVSGDGKKKKKKKRRGHAVVVIPIILCTLVMAFALYAVFVCVTTDFDEMIGAYVNAQNADVETDKLAFYETALEKCDKDDKSYNSYIEKINEQITLLTLSTKDYVNAYNYYTSASFPEIEAGKGPRFPEFKTYLEECEKIKAVGDTIYNAVLTASETANAQPATADICAALGVPAYFNDNCETIVTSIYKGITAGNDGKFADAATAYGEAITTLKGLMGGIVSQELIEQSVIAYYKAGNITQAVSFNDANMTEEMKSAPKFSEYTQTSAEIERIGSYAAGLYASVTKAIDADSAADVNSIVNALDVSAETKSFLSGIAENIAAGYRASKEGNNITAVYRHLGTASSSILDLGAVPDTDMLKLLAKYAYSYGSFEDANSIATKYFTADTLEDYDKIAEVYESFYAAYEVWYNAYAGAYYNGGAFDFDTVAASLDELVTADAADSLIAFVNFVKYYSYYSALQAEPTADDYAVMLEYLDKAKEEFPNYTLFFNQYIISILDEIGDFAGAVKQSESSLAIDSGSDIANAHIAEQARRNGNIDASLSAALAGIEKYGENTECARQAVIAYMLKNDFENAEKYLEICWDANTLGYETVIAFNALYDGDNEQTKAFLKDAVATVEAYCTSNSFTYSDATKALVNGSKTAADIFTADDFDLR